jgi:penicillin-binding protein-related factor A (putative recombinase)
LKSVKGKSLPKPKQLEGLCKIDFDNVFPVILINFRELEQTYMVSARAFEMDLKAKGKVSLNVGDIAKIGQLIPQQKIRTRYKYNF